MASSKKPQVWYGGMVQPEDAFFKIFQTSNNDPFVQQNTMGFIINLMFLVFVVFCLKFAFAEYLPTIFEVISIFCAALFSIFYLLRIIKVHNSRIINNKFNGFLTSLTSLAVVIIILGVFA